jgi:hypothetical protein
VTDQQDEFCGGCRKLGPRAEAAKRVIFYWTHFGPEFHSHLFVFDFVGARPTGIERVSAVKGIIITALACMALQNSSSKSIKPGITLHPLA